MARSVPEWVGKNDDAMPGQTVLLRLYAKQNGICACGCGQVMNLNRDKVDCDHKLALIDGGVAETVAVEVEPLTRETREA